MRRLLSVAIAFGILAGACSGDSDGAATSTSATERTQPADVEESQDETDPDASTTTGPLVSPEPDGLRASELLLPLGEGYEYVSYPASQVIAIRRDVLAGDDQTVLFLRDFTLRGVQQPEGPANVVLVYVVDPVAAVDEAFRSSVRSGFSSGLEETLVVIGTQSLVRVQDESGLYRMLWHYEDAIMQFHGVDLEDLMAAAHAVMEPLARPFPTTTTTTTTTTTAPPTTTTVVEE